jgi:hypothetical protein
LEYNDALAWNIATKHKLYGWCGGVSPPQGISDFSASRNAEYRQAKTSRIALLPTKPARIGVHSLFSSLTSLSTQYTDGLFGPLVIHDPEDAVYDERVMFLGDWYHTYSSVLLNQYMGNDRPRSY